MFRTIRIAILSLILVFVAISTWLQHIRSADWSQTQRVVIYPINGDGDPVTAEYIEKLKRDDFRPVTSYIESQGKRYGLSNLLPIDIDLAPEIHSQHPEIPDHASVLNAVRWSLSLRYWSWKVENYTGVRPQVRIYVRYFNPKLHSTLKHSAGLHKGLIGVVQAFASAKMAGANKVIITHEMLHTFGAEDHYDLATNQPSYPDGYADPDKEPRYPQEKAEIMGGRIPISPSEAKIPRSLAQTVIGPTTAREIHWTGE